MKAFYYAAIALVYISFSACEKEDSVESIISSEVDSEFFRHSKAGSSEYKSFVLNVLSQVDDSISFTGDFVATYGLPQWNVNIEIKRNDMFAMAVPVTDKEMTRINAIYYFVLGEEEFEYYLFLNDREDVAYESMKYFIQVFETRLGLEFSNTDFRVKWSENPIDKNSKTKARRNENVSCFDQYVGTKDDPYRYYSGRHCTIGTPDMEWYSNRENTISTGKINLPNPLRGGGGSGNSEPEPDPKPLPEVLPTPEFLANQKLNCIWGTLNGSNTSFQRYLNQFDADFSIVDLEFDISNSLPSNVNGRTDNSNSNKILISINGNTLGNRPVLGVARTIIHEAIHAELYRKVRSVNNQISINDFPGIYDYYRRYIKNWQHQQMAAHYIDLMGKMLKEFDGSRMSDQYYKDISWNGLYMINDKNNHGTYIYTVAFNELSPTEKTRILNNIKNLKENGNKDCN